MEKIPGHVRNWGSGGEEGGMSAAERVCGCTQCTATSVQVALCNCTMQVALCKLHCATAGGGEVKINGCVAGRFKKRGLSWKVLVVGADE